MRRKILGMMVVMIFALGFYGCASTSTVNTTIVPTVPLDSFKTVSINVQTKVEDSEKEMQAFKGILISELTKKNKWEVITGNASQGQLGLTATITNLNKVGGASRILMGALAGRASVEVEVVLKDSKGNVISQFSVNGKSSGGTIFAGTTDQALEKAAEQIVAFMDGRKN
ncbi:MAG: DUF4410 domain-containing protein [Nitrospirae bacterium]|nr:DUF4410 domain-containing protein [Nitrospirota bacterium]MDA8214166.1 DUF4410 domain-containing protein [Nitrospiraceae bacterium]MDA8338337.1 DUF4410 domain-containing protein [Nitrospiraceae bacterium]